MTTRVLIDTDPGIDDAVAILYALASPTIEVLGITTVAGNIGIERTTRNVGRILALMGREDIPVHAGAAAPLARKGFDVADIHGSDGLGGVDFPMPAVPPRDDAVAFLAETLLREPASEVVLMVLGPMTNIARLFQQHPVAARRVSRIIAMGGALRDKGNIGPRSEFNLAADPEAADIVLGSGLPIVLIPLDATRQVRATAEDCARLHAAGTPQAVFSARLIEAYFQNTTVTGPGAESRPLHDPCVMLMATNRELFGVESTGLAVDLGTTRDAGAITPEISRMLVLVATEVEGRAAVDRLIAGLS
ncbi:nucleoside hydrolase [Gemmobacter sp.]|uniref:nucleoside hydrolase n=1 Tax=Gemmobacter sp. TaxID=1898957 RepID=UPI002AFE1D5E|nr:nucleoside hydrolase [Gemmobacter sp.]